MVDTPSAMEECYRVLFEQMVDAVVLVESASGLIRYANKSASALIGYEPEDLCRMHVGDFDVVDTEKQQRNSELIISVAENSTTYKKKRADGTIIDVAVSSSNVRIGQDYLVLEIWRDITEHNRSMEMLGKNEMRLKEALNLAGVGSWELDLSDDAITWSEEVYRIFEIDPHQFDATYDAFLAVCHPDDRDNVNQVYIDSLKTRTTYAIDHRIQLPDGRIKYLHERCRHFYDENGTPIRSIGTVLDITERKKTEDELNSYRDHLKERTKELSLAVKSLKKEIVERKRTEEERRFYTQQINQMQKMESIGTLAGGIAHDFNNILSGIIGYADMALEDVSPESTLAHKLRQILQSGDRARMLVKQILNFSHGNPAEKSPQYLRPIIKEVVELLRASIPSTIEIKCTLTRDAGPVLADPTQIHEVLMNLCTNAKQAMINEKGMIEITYEESEFHTEIAGRAGTLPSGTYSVITVRDNGCGMDNKTLERIFDPFFTTKPPGEGTGMGMAVLYGIIQKNQGTVTVESIPGVGTVCTVYLPRFTASGSVEDESLFEESVPGGNERILYVDDEKLLREMTGDMLESLGYQVDIFDDGMEALMAFKDNPDAYDLVIGDRTMPVITGMELAEKIREIRPEIPFIIYTGYSGLVNEKKALVAGIDCFLTKPFRKNDMARKIRYVLEKKALNSSTYGSDDGK